MISKDFILVTAARNEEQYIGRTIESVLQQTVRPKRWVIVSDGSTDRTEGIVAGYQSSCDFLTLERKEPSDKAIGFASKVYAINLGYSCARNVKYDFVGHLDGDITLPHDYYQTILQIFAHNPRLGIGGGFVFEPSKDGYEGRPFNATYSVAGGIQLFRRECYDAIGGLIPLPTGGEDWYAEVKARMHGWQVMSFPELIVFHHKPGSMVRGSLQENMRTGFMDYLLGSHPLFELFKCVRRIKQKPFLIGAVLRLAAFAAASSRFKNRPVDDIFVKYLREEQLNKLKHILTHHITSN